MISIKENVNSIEEFNYLYDAVGWGSYDEKVSEKALSGEVSGKALSGEVSEPTLMLISSSLYRHLHTERRREIIFHSRTNTVTKIVYVHKHYWSILHHCLLSIQISLPALIETVSESGIDTGILKRGMRPIHIIIIATHSKTHLLRKWRDIHHGDILGKPHPTVSMLSNLREHRNIKAHIEAFM